jgi:hypothetical protein
MWVGPHSRMTERASLVIPAEGDKAKTIWVLLVKLCLAIFASLLFASLRFSSLLFASLRFASLRFSSWSSLPNFSFCSEKFACTWSSMSSVSCPVITASYASSSLLSSFSFFFWTIIPVSDCFFAINRIYPGRHVR